MGEAADAAQLIKVPAAAIHWWNVTDTVYTVDSLNGDEVGEWVDALFDDLKRANLRATPFAAGDPRILPHAAAQSRKQIKTLQDVFAEWGPSKAPLTGAGLRLLNDRALASRGVDATTRSVALQHIEVIVGAPPPRPVRGKADSLAPTEEKAPARPAAQEGAVKLVISLGKIRRHFDTDLVAIIREMHKYDDTVASEQEAERVVLDAMTRLSLHDPEAPAPGGEAEDGGDGDSSKQKAKKKKKKRGAEEEEPEVKQTIAIGTKGGETLQCSTFTLMIADPALQATPYMPGEALEAECTHIYQGTVPFPIDPARLAVAGVVSQWEGAGERKGINLEISFFPAS